MASVRSVAKLKEIITAVPSTATGIGRMIGLGWIGNIGFAANAPTTTEK
jgi:hypothetical protein